MKKGKFQLLRYGSFKDDIPAIISALFLCIAILVPLVRIATYASIDEYRLILENGYWVNSLRNSIASATIATLSTMLLGFTLALYTSFHKGIISSCMRQISKIPLLSPPFVVALAFIMLFGYNGFITNDVMGLTINPYGWIGLWVIQTVAFLPYAFTASAATVEEIPDIYIVAAQNLGASKTVILRKVLLPLCKTGLVSGTILVFVYVLADFGNPLIIAGNYNLLTTDIYMQIVGWYRIDRAAVYGTILLIPSLALYSISRIVFKHNSFSISDKYTHYEYKGFSESMRWLLLLCAPILILILAIYIAVAIGAFTSVWGYDWSFTLTHMQQVWVRPDTIVNTLIYSFLSSSVCTVLCFIIAYTLRNTGNLLTRLCDYVALLPNAIPGILLSLGFLLMYSGTLFDSERHASIIVIALTIWNIPACYGMLRTGFLQLGLSKEHAAKSLGARQRSVLLQIYLPLLFRRIVSSFSVSFLRSMTCLSVIILLYGAGTATASISILALINEGKWSKAAALSTTLILIAIIVEVVLHAVTNRIMREKTVIT